MQKFVFDNWNMVSLQKICDLNCIECHPLKVLDCVTANKDKKEIQEIFTRRNKLMPVPTNSKELQDMIKAVNKSMFLYDFLPELAKNF